MQMGMSFRSGKLHSSRLPSVLSLIAAILVSAIALQEGDCKMQTKRAVMIIAHSNYRDEELKVPFDILKSGGVDVKVASNDLGVAKGMLGGVTTPDMLVGDINVEDFDAVIFVGGAGASCYWDDKTAHRIANETIAKGKLLGAICIAPVTLANAGVLKGKNATVWASEGKALQAGGAHYTKKGVEIDGNIITANGPVSAEAFGKAILNKLK